MAETLPTTEPVCARAGDTWHWRRENLGDFPASAWTLKYFFRNATAKFDITATADGEYYAVDVAKATTAAYAVGSYDWIAVVENATERYQIDQGRLDVLPNLALDAIYDARSFARTMLDAVEAALLSKASGQQLDLVRATMATRSMEYNTASLMTLRSQLMAEVKREASANNGIDTRRVLVRFD